MTTSTVSRVIFTAVLSAAFVCLPGSAFAQHGGGGHGGGGGFHGGGGGGFHGGGGARSGGFSGGGRSSSAPSAPRGGGGGPRSGGFSGPSRPSGTPGAPRGSGSNPQSAPNSAGRPSGASSPATGNYRPPSGNFSGDGQWHTFAPGTGVGSTGNFAAGGATFGGFGGAQFRGTGGAVGVRGLPGTRPGLGFGFPYQNRFGVGGFQAGFGPGWGWGGWGAGWGGWGFGWGLGFNSCWGFGWTWDPFCDGLAGWPGYAGYGYGYYGYPGGYSYPPSVNYDPNYTPDSTGNYPQPSDSVTPTAPPLVEPNSDTSANLPGATAQSQAAVVIYMKDGSSILPTDYWMAEDQFHYLLGGREYIVPLSRVDLQKTNDVNHRSGATFYLKSAPDSAAPQATTDTAPVTP